jgi:DNA-binding response OmpR family regulator
MYITKPFGTRELRARIRALLRRAGAPDAETESYRLRGMGYRFDG